MSARKLFYLFIAFLVYCFVMAEFMTILYCWTYFLTLDRHRQILLLVKAIKATNNGDFLVILLPMLFVVGYTSILIFKKLDLLKQKIRNK